MDQIFRHPNGLLASLPETDFDALQPHLEPFELVQGEVLIKAGDTINRVYFPHAGIVSLVINLASGETVETGMIGRDSVVGGSSALDRTAALNAAIVQVAGTASGLEATHLRRLAETSVGFRMTLMRHHQMILVQAQQTAACNISHPIEARLPRWLLRCRDLTGSDMFSLTQEFLAQMLGVQRSSVSVVASMLQKAGLIRYRRGHIYIENLEGLLDAACECYATVKSHSDRLLNGPSA